LNSSGLLLALSEPKYRIEIGRGFEALFLNVRVARIGAEMVRELKLEHYGGAVLRSSQTIARIVAEQRGAKLRELGPRQ
jgi:uncharacterized membrane protein YgcG